MSRRRRSREEDSPPTFFLDECFAIPDLVEALRPHVPVQIFFDHFEPGTADQDWLPVVGANGWFVLTCDVQIRWRPHELEALERAGVGAFMVRAKGQRSAELVTAVVSAMPRMLKVARSRRRPFVCALHVSDGSLKLKRGGARRGGPR